MRVKGVKRRYTGQSDPGSSLGATSERSRGGLAKGTEQSNEGQIKAYQ